MAFTNLSQLVRILAFNHCHDALRHHFVGNLEVSGERVPAAVALVIANANAAFRFSCLVCRPYAAHRWIASRTLTKPFDRPMRKGWFAYLKRWRYVRRYLSLSSRDRRDVVRIGLFALIRFGHQSCSMPLPL